MLPALMTKARIASNPSFAMSPRPNTRSAMPTALAVNGMISMGGSARKMMTQRIAAASIPARCVRRFHARTQQFVDESRRRSSQPVAPVSLSEHRPHKRPS